MNAMDRPAGMTWEHPNRMALVGKGKTLKPVFVDGGWVDSFSRIRAWDGVYSKTHHYKEAEVQVTCDVCDTWIEWMLLDKGETYTYRTDLSMAQYTYYAAYNARHEMKVLTIEDGIRREYNIQDINNWKSEMRNLMAMEVPNA